MQRIVAAILRLTNWLYGPRLAAWDVLFGVLAGGWATLMVVKPAMFDRGSYVGMQWLPDEVWIAFFAALSFLHLAGLLRPYARNMRIVSFSASAWIWLFVPLSLMRVEMTTGVVCYGTLGLVAATLTIHIASIDLRRG